MVKQLIACVISNNLTMDDIREILADNLIYLMSKSADCKSQNALAKRSQKQGNNLKVGQTTIGNILRAKEDKSLPFPKLDTVENLATIFGISVGALLTKDLGKLDPAASQTNDQARRTTTLSPAAQSIVERLTELDAAQSSPPALYALIENAMDLISPASTDEAASGHPDLAAMFAQYTQDPESLTPESFALLRKQMQQVASPKTNNNEQTRKKAGGSGS